MKKNTGGVRFGAIVLGMVLCAGAPVALAQNALGDGRALDRNLRRGSGGFNTSVRDINALIRFNNSVVTGNAMGGRSFRGDTGYRSTDDFRGALGSDALFDFRRDAAPSAVPVISGIRGTDALRYQFALTTGQAPPLQVGNLPDFSGGLVRGANPIHAGLPQGVEQRPVRGSAVSTALRSTADFGAQQMLRPTILGYEQLDDGRQSVVTASPLLGVNSFVVGTEATDTGVPGYRGANFPSLNGLESVPPNVRNPLNLVESEATTRLQTQVQAPRAVIEAFERAVGEANKAPRNPADAPAPEAVITPSAPTDRPMAPSYEEELDRIRRHLNGEALPEDGDADSGAEDVGEGTKTPTLHDLIEAQTGKVDIDVLKALQATRPLLVRLAPEAPTTADTYAAHMARGERLLERGRYFDAEDSFIRALALAPKDPMANVGRVHAELGAGLFLSAAANLKAYFAEQPPMIGVRYAQGLTPSKSRSASLSEQLRSIVATPTSGMGKEAGMLLAYLGYQQGEMEQVKEGLDAMEARTYPEQTRDLLLLGLLRKIWVEGRDLPPATPAPAAPASTPATSPTPPTDQNK